MKMKQPPQSFQNKKRGCPENFMYENFMNDKVPFQLRTCNFIKKQTLAQVLPCEFCKIFKSMFFSKHSG